MKKSCMAISVSVLLAVSLFTGCASGASSSSAAPVSTSQGTSQQGELVSLSPWNVTPPPSKNFPINTVEYSLGTAILQSAPTPSEYPLRGVISYPKGQGEGPFPLVVILHGSHENIVEDVRFDTGFTYLCEALAQNGYVAAALDVSVAYLWHWGENDLEKMMEITQHHLAKLQEANAGTIGELEDLTNKIDFEKRALLGHSRGGGTIFEIAAAEEEKGTPVQGLIAVAPAAMTQREDFPDVPTHLLVPEFDGDVSDWQGYFFSYLLRESNATATTTLSLLHRANHNYFNRNVQDNDALRLGFIPENQKSREEQEKFLMDYTVTALAEFFTGEPMVNPAKQTPTTLFGQDASTIVYSPNRQVVFAASEKDTLTLSAGAQSEAIVDSWFFMLDTAHFVQSLTYGDGQFQTKDLVRATWSEAGDSFAITPPTGDFTGSESLMIEVGLDSATFSAPPELRLSLSLTDTAGVTQTVLLPKEEPALGFVEGEKEVLDTTDPPYYWYSRHTPIMGVTLPLSLWNEVDLANITAITITVEEGAAGSILLENCSLYPKAA